MEFNLNRIWTMTGFEGGSNLWILEVFAAVLLTLSASFTVKRVLNRMAKKLTQTKNVWDDVFLEAARRPFILLIWVVGLAWAAEIVDERTNSTILNAIEPIRDVTVIVLLTWFMTRLLTGGEKVLMEPKSLKTPMDPTTAHAIGKLLRASVVITSALVVLQSLGYSISGVLAFGGIGGIAVGFAAKDLLANFFGGLMIYLDRPFNVGDWIRSPDQDIEGTVEYIGWRQTRIRTFSKRPLYVPNATFASVSVENPSRMTNRRIYETVSIRYDDASQIKSIIDGVRGMLRNHPEIDANQTLIVNLNKFAPSSLDFFVYTFTKTTDWIKFHGIKEDVMLKIIEIVNQHGAQLAFPTRTLQLPEHLGLPVVHNKTS